MKWIPLDKQLVRELTVLIMVLCLIFGAAGIWYGMNHPHVPPCHCGCMETGKCQCKNCCQRTADPTWKE